MPIKTLNEALQEYLTNENEDTKEDFKKALIGRVLTADSNAKMNGAKFVLENLFDWKNGGAIQEKRETDTIKVEFVSAFKEKNETE